MGLIEYSKHLIVPETIENNRKQICNDCEFNMAGICKKCSCLTKFKIKLKNSQCPVKKWSKYSAMNKKIAVIGRGTSGSLSIAHFLRWTDWEIDWYFDPNIPTLAVGEGSNLKMPTHLFEYFNFSHNDDLLKIDGTLKTGIYKEGWGNLGKHFFHDFQPPFVAYHFNALKFQQFVFDKVKCNDRIRIIEQEIDHKDIDADFIMDCSGKPKTNENLIKPRFIPVNSVYVTQCYWDMPKFQYTLTIAKKYGWVFGIPLQNRCSIGYLYNNSINSLEEIKEDLQEIFERFNLKPSETTNAFTFGNYYRKNNFDNRVCYNGNASFFLEPLEATSISTMILNNQLAFDVWNGNKHKFDANKQYYKTINNIETMIMLHYFASSKYNSKFWEYAEERGLVCISEALKSNEQFKNIIKNSLDAIASSKFHGNVNLQEGFAVWNQFSFNSNIIGLGIQEKLKHLLSD